MNRRFRVVVPALLLTLAAVAGSAGRVSAASQTACEVLPASQVSGIVGKPVTAHARASSVSSGSSTCLYEAGRPFFQLGLVVMETAAVAAQNVKMEQQTSSKHHNVGSRQKGNIVLSGITMGGDPSKGDALLDAAVRNLSR
jgi:hypothetical protein